MSFNRFIAYLFNDLLKFRQAVALKIVLNSISIYHRHTCMSDSFKMNAYAISEINR